MRIWKKKKFAYLWPPRLKILRSSLVLHFIFLIKNYNLNILSLSTSFQFGRKENSGTLTFVGRSLVFSVPLFSLTSQIYSRWQSTKSHTSLSCLVSLSFSFRFVFFSLSLLLYLYPQQPSKTSLNKISTHAHHHKWQDQYTLWIGPLFYFYFL